MFTTRSTILVSLVSCLMVFNFLEAYVMSNPPHKTIYISQIQEEHILSATEDQRTFILKFLREFDQNLYQIHMVPNLGMFFLDVSQKPDWIKDILRRGCVWENYIENLIKLYACPGTVALDIGAHIGTHTFAMARAVGDLGKVIAFEPQLKTCREHFMNAALNGATNIYTFWAALGDKSGEIDLPNFIPQCEIVQLHDHAYGLSGIKAPLITLDSLAINNVSLMKVDVDGWEGKFLDGARETILRNKPVIIIEIEGGYDVESPQCSQEVIDRAKIGRAHV